MTPFDFQLFGRTLALASRTRPDETTWHVALRLLRLALGVCGYVLLEVVNFLCLVLDELLYPEYQKVPVQAPVFIMGHPRSGTTFLHRVLSQDRDRFFVFRTWEILFPSIVQKKLGTLLGRADRALGRPLGQIIETVERRILGTFHDLHPTGLFHAEEDEMLFLHCFASLYLVFFFPWPAEFLRFADFDREVPQERRRRLMAYYRTCVQRQAVARGPAKTFLSKNPFFGGKVQSLRETFPDAHFIYLVRDPLAAIPSTISEGHASCLYADHQALPSPEFQELVYQVAALLYRRPLEHAAAQPGGSFRVLRFEDLVARPHDTIASLYQELGYTASSEFQQVLAAEQAQASAYRSKHVYDARDFVITEARMRADFADIIERFAL